MGNNIQPELIVKDSTVLQQRDLLSLKIKLKSMEENALLNVHQLNDIQKRVEALESAGIVNTANDKWNEDDEDWEKMYYETRREKQSLEENVSYLKDTLQKNTNRLLELEKQQEGWATIKSDMELKVNEVHSLQNIIEELQRKIEGGMEKERELQQEVAYEKSRYNEYEHMLQENNQLRSETELLTSRLYEINEQNILMEQQIKSLTELGSMLEISEFEKMEIKNSVEQLLQKNMV
ncbi:MAG: hypothetical protein ABIN97_17970 [Ginsengibacter sp.]